MQDLIEHAGQAPQGGRPVQVARQRHGAGLPPALVLGRVPQQGENAIAPEELGQGAPGHIAATDNQ